MHGGGITGSLLGTSSFTITASYAASASFIVGGSTDSASFATTASYAETASYAANVPETASYALTSSIAVSSSYASSSLSASYAYDSDTSRFSLSASYVALAQTSSLALNARTASFFAGTASRALSSSYAFTASYAENVPETSSYALTSSIAISSSLSATASLAVTSAFAGNTNLFQGNQPNVFITTGSTSGNQNITGSLTITENLIVQGSSSFTYITASQILLAQNTITVFGSGSAVPLAGYKAADTSSVYDSGSLLFSLPNQNWVFNKPLIVSGGLIVSGALTASLDGTSSWALTASLLAGTASFAYTASNLAGTASFAATASILDGTASYAYTASNLAGTASWAEFALTASYISGGLLDTAATASWATNSISSSYLSGSQAFLDSLTVYGTASIAYLSATIISASVTTGSNIFGSSNNDIHQFTGSVSITGSLTMNDSPINAPQITGSLDGTASYAITASYVLGGTETASIALTASYIATASFSQLANTASYALTASYIETASYVLTASYIATASNALTSSWANNAVLLRDLGPGSFINTGSTGAVQAVTGSLVITEGLTVLGSASISYITASQTVLNQNKLLVFTSGSSVPVGGYVVADTSSWNGTGSYTNTGSLLYNSQLQTWYLSHNLILSGSLPKQGFLIANYGIIQGDLTVYGVIDGTASRALRADTASYLEGAGSSETSSYAISAYQKSFISHSEEHTIHEGHFAQLPNVYNEGTYSLNQGSWEFPLGTSSLFDNAHLEVDQFYNNGIVINNGEFATYDSNTEFDTSGSNTIGNSLNDIQQITGSVGITGSLDLNGDALFDSNLGVANNLYVTNDSILFGSLNVIQEVAVGSSLGVLGTSSFASSVSMSNNLYLAGNLTVSGTIGDNLKISGSITHTGSVGVLGSVGISGSINSVNNITALGTITATSFTGSLFGSITSAFTSSYLSSSGDALTNRLIVLSKTTRSIELETAYLSSTHSIFAQGINLGLSTSGIPSSHSLFRVVGNIHPNSASIVLGEDNFFGGINQVNKAPSITRTAGDNDGDAMLLSALGGIVMRGSTGYPAIAINYSSSNQVVFGGIGTPIENPGTTPSTIQSWGYGNNFFIANGNAPSNDYYKMYAYFLTGTSRYYVTDNNNNGVYLSKGGTSWTSTSDERKKDIIEPITNAIEKVEGLRTVIGKFKSDPEGTRRSFFIAQDMVTQFPEAVEASDSEDLGINYTETSPLLAAAIKELSQENKQLKAELAEIRSILSQLS